MVQESDERRVEERLIVNPGVIFSEFQILQPLVSPRMGRVSGMMVCAMTVQVLFLSKPLKVFGNNTHQLEKLR